MNEVLIPKRLLLEEKATPEVVTAYARLKAGLIVSNKEALRLLAELGYIERKEQKKREFSQLSRVRSKIRKFQVDKGSLEPFEERWQEFIRECSRVKRVSCISSIIYHLQNRLQERSLESDIKMAFPTDWVRRQMSAAHRMVNLYPSWNSEQWVEVVDWFIDDDFWGNIVIDVATMEKHLPKYVIWRQKKEPHKKQLRSLKVIGRKK
jgi:hypothetical protein